MTALLYMSRALVLNTKINRKLRRLEGLREAATRTTATVQEDVVSRTRNVHPMADIIDRMVDMEHEIDEDIDRLVSVKEELSKTISQVDDPVYQSVLELRYVCFKEWDEIAQVLNYNKRTPYKIHAKALEAVQEILDSEKCPENWAVEGTCGQQGIVL